MINRIKGHHPLTKSKEVTLVYAEANGTEDRLVEVEHGGEGHDEGDGGAERGGLAVGDLGGAGGSGSRLGLSGGGRGGGALSRKGGGGLAGGGALDGGGGLADSLGAGLSSLGPGGLGDLAGDGLGDTGAGDSDGGGAHDSGAITLERELAAVVDLITVIDLEGVLAGRQVGGDAPGEGVASLAGDEGLDGAEVVAGALLQEDGDGALGVGPLEGEVLAGDDAGEVLKGVGELSLGLDVGNKSGEDGGAGELHFDG